jgi:protein-L-isoaspartate O-methyltransferase
VARLSGHRKALKAFKSIKRAVFVEKAGLRSKAYPSSMASHHDEKK